MSEGKNPGMEGQDEATEEVVSSEDLLEEWPFSNNFILAAILLLIAAAFTLAFRTEEKANQYAIWAYYSLVIGVFLRFVEIVLEERFDIELKPYTYRKLEPIKTRLKAVLSKFKDTIMDLIGPYISRVRSNLQRSRDREDSMSEPEAEDEKKIPGYQRSLSRLKAVLSGLTSYSIVKEVYVCEECGSRFGSRKLLQEHREKIHS